MALTIKVNGLTLCHKGSGGISTATAPDVCKTPAPGGPVPIPYPNIALSKQLRKGTKTVKVDGGNPVAVKGSYFAPSTGDEPGTAGGVKSGTFKGKATWLSFSPDVKMEGKPVCRLTDKMLMNDGNTVNLAGLIQAPLEAWPELMAICALICQCDKLPIASASGESELKQECVEKALIAADDAAGGMSPIKAEIPYNMTTVPPTPITTRQMPGLLRATQYLPRRMKELGLRAAGENGGIYQVRIPDAVVTRTPQDISNKALTAPNLKSVVEIKFNYQPRDQEQLDDYAIIAGGEDKVVELSPAECRCGLPEPERASALEKVREKVRERTPSRVEVPMRQPDWVERTIESVKTATGLTGAALIAYLIISEGSRILFPPRNLIPVP
ncbi:DUF4150 domain-containing protein [Candidatus Thiosymbion oneisti]|uniref:DUF4150 domain-containing protein n=1 Tax=Candidatus Thiosymbion oneisti TaxID=589554 RepID=UPI00105F7A33|nr:DUF4150 domain-containing protein [Candidatus Thiosymbion oneisti]